MKAAKLLFVLVWLMLPFTKCAESGKGLHYMAHQGSISDQCLRCICMKAEKIRNVLAATKVESNCQPVGCVMDMGSLSCGYYQIKLPYYEDCGSPGGGWQACANDYSCATNCVRNYMARYGPISGCPDTCETYARIHNGGPQGCNNPNTIPYWRRVQSFGC